jgi:hypothetical protein
MQRGPSQVMASLLYDGYRFTKIPTSFLARSSLVALLSCWPQLNSNDIHHPKLANRLNSNLFCFVTALIPQWRVIIHKRHHALYFAKSIPLVANLVVYSMYIESLTIFQCHFHVSPSPPRRCADARRRWKKSQQLTSAVGYICKTNDG